MTGQVRRKLLLAAAVISASANPSGAMASTTAGLEPTGPWNVHYAAQSCMLLRGYGDATKPDLLMMERFEPSDRFQLVLISDQLRYYEQGSMLRLRYGDGERIIVKGAMPGKADDGRASLTISSTAIRPWPESEEDEPERLSITPEQEAAATSLTVSFRGRDVTFRTGPLDKAFAALRKCTDDLVRSWGLDPVQQSRLSAPAKPLSKPRSWITSSAYPRSMILLRKQGLVNFRLSVNETGTPTACQIQRSYSDEAFDKVTCELLMRNARFSPALDESGKAVPSYFVSGVRFIIAT
ncbi:TonB family protein [Novosphingobium sp. RD2P27]|uniref:TonB family protein n=1 Tax=Novosphingobium kalidii TaxID=3230299 RepID=A0ABV2CWP2_9SPHN